MKELIEYLVKLIVKNPEEIAVAQETDGDDTHLKLTVAPSDLGLVIGKGGNIIRALRTLLRVRAIKENKKVTLELSEPSPLTPPASA